MDKLTVKAYEKLITHTIDKALLKLENDWYNEYCTDNEYQIIEVYFQDDEALLLDNFSRTRFVAIYEDGYWE